MSKKLVTYEVENGVAQIGLNDPARLNVLSTSLVRDFNQALEQAENSADVAVIIIHGYGRAFCVGGDLKEFLKISSSQPDDIIKKWEHLSFCKLPVIAAVHGYAMGGGCELMLMADYVIATSDTKFVQPELKFGFIPGCGATQRLAKRIGHARAFDMMAAANQINASDAYAIGLVDKVTEDDLLSTAQAIALTWAKQGRAELINLKSAMHGSYQQERQLFYQMVAGDNAQQRIQQFLNKDA